MEKRLTADLNVVANSNLEIQLLDGDLNIIQKLDDEPNDVGGLTSAELKAKFDESGNIIKKYINETLIPAVLTEDATEESRKQAEAARVAAEQGRVTAEEGRVSAETARAAAEQARSEAESSRVSAENARKAAEQARADETAGIVARATAQANAAAGSASQAAGSEQRAKDAAGTATGAASTASNAASYASQAAAAASGSASQAQASAAAAAQSAANGETANKSAQSWAVGGTGTRPGEDTNNAKYWAEHAEAVAGGDFATKVEALGYVTAHNESVEAHPDLRIAVAGSIRYDAAQSLTDEQKAQARTNIGAANGTFKTVHLDNIGWYRIATCRNSGGGILSLQHGWGSGGPSSFKFLVTMDVWNPALKCIDTDCFRPQFTNARMVKLADGLTAIDVYYNVKYDNSPVICFIQTGQNSVAIQDPSYISDSDALPDGETLLLPMEYLNPPMAKGIEYRTTERYLGKPVYMKVFQAFESLAKGGSVYNAPISNVAKVISCTGESGGWNLPSDVIGGEVAGNFIHIGTQRSSTAVQVYAITNRETWAAPVYVTLRYTKTTD